MPLHPQARQLLDMLEAAGLPPLPELSPRAARLQVTGLTEMAGPGPEVAEVKDIAIAVGHGAEIGARVYTPEDPIATIVWLHGGGWVICDLDSHDAMCRTLANASGCRVVAVDYRRAPEHPFPVPLEDCWAALEHVAARHAGQPLILGGDSAGGNLTAVCTQRARDRGGPQIALQVLVYPAVDLTTTDRESFALYGDGPETFLTLADMEWFGDHYLGDAAARATPEVSPLHAGTLAGLPPASIVTAEYDPLRDEGLAYMARLREDGVPVSHHHFDDQIHAFFALVNILDSASDAIGMVAADVRAAVAPARAGA